MFCKKVSKSNETTTIDQVCRGRWKIFLDLERSSSFLCQKCFLLKWHRFYLLSELYHCNGKIYHFLFFIFSSEFLSRPLTIQRAAGERSRTSLFLSTISIHSGTFWHFFQTLHLRWLPRIVNCIAYNYQAATR